MKNQKWRKPVVISVWCGRKTNRTLYSPLLTLHDNLKSKNINAMQNINEQDSSIMNKQEPVQY